MPNLARSRLAAVLCLGALLPPRPISAQLPQPDLALVHAQVVNVTDGSIRNDATVIVRHGRTESITTGPVPAGTQVIDLAGKYLLPGLMDAHTHLDNLEAAKRASETGATTVRAGYFIGPDMIAAAGHWCGSTSAMG